MAINGNLFHEKIAKFNKMSWTILQVKLKFGIFTSLFQSYTPFLEIGISLI